MKRTEGVIYVVDVELDIPVKLSSRDKSLLDVPYSGVVTTALQLVYFLIYLPPRSSGVWKWHVS
jgi:hypothetical protein